MCESVLLYRMFCLYASSVKFVNNVKCIKGFVAYKYIIYKKFSLDIIKTGKIKNFSQK